MKNFFTPIYPILFLLLCNISVAQQNQNSLLWKIEGNNLSSPSYLYGTIHVHDNRVFNFSDSVFIALEACEAFALEVHPDSMILATISSVQENFNNSYYEELLSEEELDRFKDRFKNINGYEFEELDNKNPLTVQNLLEPSYERPDDKQAFMDVYLYSVAKSMSKEIHGLENHREQMDQIKGMSKAERKKMIMEKVDYPEEMAKSMREQMVKLYATGDLNKIQEFIGNYILSDSLFILRNETMTNSIIDVIHTKSLFSAVGAAHLVGDISVVQMLKNRGYRVTPVTQSYTGIADQYVPDLLSLPWETYTDSLSGFSLQLPSFPNEMTFDFNKIMVSLDLITESAYAFMNLDLRDQPDTFSTEKMINMFMTNLESTNYEILSEKTLESIHGPISEYLIQQHKNQQFRVQIIEKNGFIHYYFFWSKKDNLYSSSADKFFNSATYFMPKVSKVKTGWFTYADSTYAFSIMLPSFPESKIQELPNAEIPNGDNYKVEILYSPDMSTFTNYLIAVNDLPRGMYMEDTNLAMDLLIDELIQGGNEIKNIDTIEFQGVPGREFDCILREGYHCKFKVFQRGNRTYKVLKQNLQIGHTEFTEDQFFESFTFLPYQKTEFVEQNAKFDKESFIELDNSQTTYNDTLEYASFYAESYSSNSKNIFSGGMYQVEINRLNDFFRIENLDSFYYETNYNLEGWNDTVLQEQIIDVNGRKRFESVQKYKGSKVVSRYQFWIHNDIYHFLGVSGTEEEVFSDAADLFYSSYSDNDSGEPMDYYSSKSQAILDGLRSKDKKTFKKSEGALKYYYRFEEKDLPLLQKSLNYSYADDSLWNGIKSQLVSEIGMLKKEESITPLLRLYESTTNSVKESILSALVDIESPQSIKQYSNLLFTNPPDSLENGWITMYPLLDSLELLQANLSNLMKLHEKEAYKDEVLTIISYALSTYKDTLSSDVEPYFDVLTLSAITELKDLIKEKVDYPDQFPYNGNIHHYITLMDHIKGKSITDEFTTLYAQQDTSFYTQATAMSTRILNNLEIARTLRNQLIDTLITRGMIFNAYKEIKALEEFPAKWLEDKEVVKMAAYNYFADYLDYYPQFLEYIDNITINNENYIAFKTAFSYDEGTQHYLALSKFDKNDNPAEIYESATTYFDWSLYNANWKSTAKKLVAE